MIEPLLVDVQFGAAGWDFKGEEGKLGEVDAVGVRDCGKVG